VGPYTYAWSTGENTPTISNLSPDTYTLTLTDVNGCQMIDSILITPLSTINIDTTIVDVGCYNEANGSIDLTITVMSITVSQPDFIVANSVTLNTCDNSNETGSGTFFLHDANPAVSSVSGMMISYHATLLDAQNGTGILISPYSSSNGIVYARVERVSTGCFATSEITLVVGAKCVENCNNGIDEDGDGLIDCDDPDCPCCKATAPTLNGLNKKD